jgi:hypothetical protein
MFLTEHNTLKLAPTLNSVAESQFQSILVDRCQRFKFGKDDAEGIIGL